MKRTLLALAAALLLCAPLRADEGMWLLPLLKQLNGKDLKAAGLKLSPDEIYHINKSSLKDAIVLFGSGCTGEIVSREGLLLTNHHCGYGHIQALSSVEHNYLRDGFWAMDRSEEIPAPGLSVSFVERIEDLTPAFEKALAACATEEERMQRQAELIREAEARVRNENPHLTGRVSALYGGNLFYLFVYKIYTDIRFVGAPPSSIGKFGADTDNWMWPRHTCDFSMFRVYAGPDNEPAAYSPQNRPLQAKRALDISLDGVENGDYTMIMGFPGTTTRFMTASQVKEQKELINDIGIQARTLRQNVLLEDMLADPKVQLQYASKYSGSSNAWKKWRGMNETFEKLNIAERRGQEEEAFSRWVQASPERQARYGDALALIDGAVAGRREPYRVMRYLTETLARMEFTPAQLTARLLNTEEAPAPEAVAALKAQLQKFYKDYSFATDRKVAKAMIKLYKEEMEAPYLPAFYQVIDSEYQGNIDAFVDYVFDHTAYGSFEQAWALIEKGDKEAALADPYYKVLVDFVQVQNAVLPQYRKHQTAFAQGHRKYIGGVMEMNQGKAMYPDATLTLRLTYGHVMNYRPKDGVMYDHYTTLTGVMEKENPESWEFIVPEKLKTLYRNKDYGRYARPGEELRTAFLTNNDITGGNSGSPVLDSRGRLIGLAFDGNWESMSSDVIFEPQLQRCIAVDIRYVCFIIDKFGGAGHLLQEMNIIQKK